MTIDTNGNVIQNRDKGGFVKAMVYVNGDGTLLRCYNGQTGSSSGNCGFTAARNNSPSGQYIVDFGFQISDRFWSATSHPGPKGSFANIVPIPSAANSLLISVTDPDGTLTDRPVMVIVY